MEERTRRLKHNKPHKCFSQRVLLLEKEEEEQGDHTHSCTYFSFLSSLTVMAATSLGKEECFLFLLAHTHTHTTLLHTLSPNELFMYFFNISLQNLVTKFSSCLDKCPRSMVDVISRIYMSIILFGHFSYNSINLTYVN